jgi:prefoldin subunit 5
VIWCMLGVGFELGSHFGFQTPAKAIAFYDDKVKGLESNLQDLEKVVQTKSTQLRVVEESKFIS